MPAHVPIAITNLYIYGSAGIPWSRPRDLLDAGPNQTDIPGGESFVILGTTRLDGRPHAASISARWLDDAFTAPFSAPSAGPPPWHLYRVTIHTAFGAATAEPYGATRWRFAH